MKLRVFIDGVEVQFTNGFDTITGECTVYLQDESGNFYLTEEKEIACEVRRGKIDVICEFA